MPAPLRKKRIEVALPLEAINRAAAREKSIRHGHPRRRGTSVHYSFAELIARAGAPS